VRRLHRRPSGIEEAQRYPGARSRVGAILLRPLVLGCGAYARIAARPMPRSSTRRAPRRRVSASHQSPRSPQSHFTRLLRRTSRVRVRVDETRQRSWPEHGEWWFTLYWVVDDTTLVAMVDCDLHLGSTPHPTTRRAPDRLSVERRSPVEQLSRYRTTQVCAVRASCDALEEGRGHLPTAASLLPSPPKLPFD
jgi:hypothetical protein